MKRTIFVLGILFISAGLINSCGDGGGGGGSDAKGPVALYIADDISNYDQVEIILTHISLIHTGSGDSCTLFEDRSGHITDIANLDDTIQLIGTTDCVKRSYNRVHLEFLDDAFLMDNDGVSSACMLTSYKDERERPNALVCSGRTCSMDITGVVNVLARQINPFLLDFDLKNFEVDGFGTQACAVTMKVHPLDGHDIEKKKAKGYKEGISGIITDLPGTPDGTFALTTKWGDTFTIDYSELTGPGLYTVLQLAYDHVLRVRVRSDFIDVTGITPIKASSISVKACGTISGLDPGLYRFTLTNPAKDGLSISVDYSDAVTHGEVEGILSDTTWVEVKLDGYQNPYYLAREVEVEEKDHCESDD